MITVKLRDVFKCYKSLFMAPKRTGVQVMTFSYGGFVQWVKDNNGELFEDEFETVYVKFLEEDWVAVKLKFGA